MEEFNMQSEAFDFGSSAEKKAIKHNEKFKRNLILTIIFATIVFIAILIIVINSYAHRKVPMLEAHQEITADGEYLYNVQTAIMMNQANIVRDKTSLYETKIFEDENGYIKNEIINVFTDGTFRDEIVESYGSNYVEYRYMGTMDVSEFNNYINKNKEVLMSCPKVIRDDELHEYYTLNSAVVNVGKKQVFVYGDEGEPYQTYINDLLDFYRSAEKDYVQEYKITRG